MVHVPPAVGLYLPTGHAVHAALDELYSRPALHLDILHKFETVLDVDHVGVVHVFTPVELAHAAVQLLLPVPLFVLPPAHAVHLVFPVPDAYDPAAQAV